MASKKDIQYYRNLTDLILKRLDEVTITPISNVNIETQTQQIIEQPQVAQQQEIVAVPPTPVQEIVLEPQPSNVVPEQPVDRTQIEVEEQPIVQPQIAETVSEQPESVVEQLQQPTLDVSPDEWTQVVQPPTPNEPEITGVMPQQGGNPILELSDDEDEFQ